MMSDVLRQHQQRLEQDVTVGVQEFAAGRHRSPNNAPVAIRERGYIYPPPRARYTG